MSEKEDYVDNDLPRPWFLRFLVRKVLPFCVILIVISVVLTAVFVDFNSDRHYMTYTTIIEAEKTVRVLYLKRDANGDYPAKLADLSAIDDLDLNDAWGNPFRYAVVRNELGEAEAYVWAEKIEDGKINLLGAKVKADGTVIKFGLPND